MGKSLGWLVLAVVAGAVVGGSGAALLASGSPDAGPVPSTVPSAAAEPVTVEAPWVEGGVRFRSSVLVPVAFVVGDGVAELEYDVVPLHWTVSVAADRVPAEIPVRPESWALETAGGLTFEATTSLDDEVVRFDVPDDLEAAEVAEVTVTGWRVAAPVASELVLPIEVGARGSFPDGSTIEIDTVLEQSDSTIVQLNSRAAEAEWTGHELAAIATKDPQWRVTFRFNQSSNLQLIWEGSAAPSQLELVQAEPAWIAVDSDTVVIGADRE